MRTSVAATSRAGARPELCAPRRPACDLVPGRHAVRGSRRNGGPDREGQRRGRTQPDGYLLGPARRAQRRHDDARHIRPLLVRDDPRRRRGCRSGRGVHRHRQPHGAMQPDPVHPQRRRAAALAGRRHRCRRRRRHRDGCAQLLRLRDPSAWPRRRRRPDRCRPPRGRPRRRRPHVDEPDTGGLRQGLRHATHLPRRRHRQTTSCAEGWATTC